MWRVRAGDFQFRIGSDFALRTFEVNEADTLKGLNGKTRVYSSEVDAALLARAMRHTDVKDLGVGITADPYSNPMWLHDSPFEVSHLAVIIDSTDQSLTDESVNIAEEPLHWQVTPIVKEVPLALWKKYNSSEDPTRPEGGNHITTLLNSSASTVKLCMGLSIHAPPPVLEKPRIPKFKVEEANSADVNGEPDRDPHLAVTPKPQTDWVPTRVQYDATDKKSAQDAWNTTADSWLNAKGVQPNPQNPHGESDLQSLVDECVSFLGWDQPNADQIAQLGFANAQSWKDAKPWALDATVPPQLVGNGASKIGFGDGEYYLALPMVTKVTGA
jgi:hypothetical protein